MQATSQQKQNAENLQQLSTFSKHINTERNTNDNKSKQLSLFNFRHRATETKTINATVRAVQTSQQQTTTSQQLMHTEPARNRK